MDGRCSDYCTRLGPTQVWGVASTPALCVHGEQAGETWCSSLMPPSLCSLVGHVANEDGPCGARPEPAAHPVPLPGAGLHVLRRLEAAPPPMGRPQ